MHNSICNNVIMYNSQSCQTFSNAFEISRKTPRTLRKRLQSNDFYILRETDISCWTQESRGIKPD